jgi:hypothetical protein
MKTERMKNGNEKRAPRGAAQNIFAAVHPDWRLAASDYVAAVTAATNIENGEETNMQDITNFTHPIELSDKELDLVAAGWNNGGAGNGNNVFQAGLVNLNDVLSNDNVNISLLSGVSQRTGG